MANSAFDNLFVTPAPLPSGNAAPAPASGDRRGFDDALLRAYQPAAVHEHADATSRRADSRDSVQSAMSGGDSSTGGTSSDRQHDSDELADSKSTDHSTRTGGRGAGDSDRSISPTSHTKVLPPARGKARATHKKESSTKTPAAGSTVSTAHQPVANPPASPGTNPVSQASTTNAEPGGASATSTVANAKGRQIAQTSIAENPSAGGQSTESVSGDSEAANRN